MRKPKLERRLGFQFKVRRSSASIQTEASAGVWKIDAKQEASAVTHERSKCVTARAHRSKRRLLLGFGKIDA
jgi:hypothetical protein